MTCWKCDDFVLSELHPLPTFFRLNSQSSAEYHTRQDFVSSQTAFGVDLEAQQSLLAQSGGVHTSSTLHLRGFRFSAKNISFYVYRKALWWIPCLRAERGLLDITLAQGAEADIIFESSQSLDDQEVKSFLNISSVSFRLPGVDFRVRESFHPVLFWIARPLARAALKMAVSWALSSQLHRFLEHVDRSLYSLHIKARQYERRGYSMLAAWIAATTERADAPVPETESPASNPERDDNSHGSGLHVTNKGVIKDLNRNATGGTAMALGIGEQILGAEQHGPEHTGPSGAHGAGSGGRIITELDEETRDFLGDAVQAKRRGQELFEGFQEAVQDAPQLQRRVAEACDNEHDKSPSVTKPWYSDAFDLT